MTHGDPRVRVDGNFYFEVDPKAAVFDRVRESVTDTVIDEYGHLIAVDDARSAFRTNHVILDPCMWRVEGTLTADGAAIDVTLDVPADGDASDTVTDYVDAEVDDRFAFEPTKLRYRKVRLAPGAWFVDAVVEGV
jgi:hypothetical protein